MPDILLEFMAAPGLKGRNAVKGVRIDGELTDNADGGYADDIDQVVFVGSYFMDEVVFYHKSSRTAIFTDPSNVSPQKTPKASRDPY